MKVSSADSNPIISYDLLSQAGAHTAPTAKVALPPTDDSPLPDTAEARAAGDASVAPAFAQALALRSYQMSATQPPVQVPAQSTLGRWRTLLDSAFRSPRFVVWAKEQGLDTKSLKLDPYKGELTGTVDGKTHTFSLRDDSGWSDVSRTLLSVASAIAPAPGQAFDYPWPDGEVPMYTVGRFYNVPIDLTPAQAVEHRKKLVADTPFEFPPVTHAQQRSVGALAQYEEALGDDANLQALITALKSQVDDANGNIDLEKTMVPIDPRSRRFATEQRREISVAQFLRQDGNKVPSNSQQASRVASALSFDLAHRAPGERSGGVKPLTRVLGSTSMRKMQAQVNAWKQQRVSQASDPKAGNGTGTAGLLHPLISLLPEAIRKLVSQDPALALDKLIRLPEAQALGKDIQEKIKLLETTTSTSESVSAALVQELDPGLGKSPFNLAGYNLYSADNAGASAAEIVKRFTAHLEKRVGAEAAPIAARLLLSVAAPEFLVKDIPPNLVFGSHTWTNFSIEVARIEHLSPAASGNMTFSQVMAFGNTPPISVEGEQELSLAARTPIINWGVANDIIEQRPDSQYTDVELKHSQDALNEQQRELAAARKILLTPPETRRSSALTELKRVFPDIDPTLEVLQSRTVKHTPLSLLDIYMSGPIDADKWMSLDENKLPYNTLRSRFASLVPDINEVFSSKFKAYWKEQTAAWEVQFRFQLSLLPKAEREHIKASKISFFEVTRPYLKTELDPTGARLFPGRRLRTPTPQELEDLKGRHGVLIKAEGPDGQVRAYSYFPGQGKMIREQSLPDEQKNFDDSAYFGGSSKGRVTDTSNSYKQYGTTQGDLNSPDTGVRTKGTFFSQKSGVLASTVAEFFMRGFDAAKHEAAGVTEIEKGRAYDEKLKNFFLSLIPFYDGIKDAIKGDVGGAAFNIGFDLLGFLLPGFSAGRRAFKAGKGPINIIKSGVYGGIGASVGYTDIVDIPRNLNSGVRAGYKDIKHLAASGGEELLSKLRGNYPVYSVNKIYKEGDVVKGFMRSVDDDVWHPVVAIFKKGAWYAYNVITKTPFGVQAAQFGVMDAATS
jgi:hypothetical protein